MKRRTRIQYTEADKALMSDAGDRAKWSSHPVAGSRKRTYPQDGTRQVPHETIYRTLFYPSPRSPRSCVSGSTFRMKRSSGRTIVSSAASRSDRIGGFSVRTS